jgi:hypothetical protein
MIAGSVVPSFAWVAVMAASSRASAVIGGFVLNQSRRTDSGVSSVS